jgi:hypothetical protein
METMSDDKQILYIKVMRILIRRGWRMYFPTGRYLHVSIGFKSFHLRWVPHLLTDDLRQTRKEHASAMLPFLYAAQCDGWHHLVTADESWFFFNTSPCRMWTLSRDDVATKPRLDIQSKNSCL